MKLYIDTSQREKIVIGLDAKRFSTDAIKEKSQKLLPFINETLEKENIKLTDLTEIEVNTGPGSFTGLRIGVSVANALGWSLNIPVNSKDVSKSGSVEINYG